MVFAAIGEPVHLLCLVAAADLAKPVVFELRLMRNRPASWRMPTPKQMERMAVVVSKNVPTKPGLAPDDDTPQEYWQAVLDDLHAEARPAPSRGALRLSQFRRHLLLVGCRRCGRLPVRPRTSILTELERRGENRDPSPLMNSFAVATTVNRLANIAGRMTATTFERQRRGIVGVRLGGATGWPVYTQFMFL